MKTLACALLGLTASCTLAFGHSVRNSDGSLREHDHHAAVHQAEGIRNVSANWLDAPDCQAATWPDIPPRCLERDEKGPRLLSAASSLERAYGGSVAASETATVDRTPIIIKVGMSAD